MNSPAELRVVSLIASATEIVAALGMERHLVGVSHECDYPAIVDSLPALSRPRVDPASPSALIDADVRAMVAEGLSVYSVDVDGLRRLRPDVILTQDHCEVCAVALADVEAALCELDLPDVKVCSLHPRDLADVRRDIRTVASALRVPGRGEAVVTRLDARLSDLASRTADLSRPRVALVEWLAPPMVAGGWMPELARIAGCDPVIVTGADDFAEVSWETIADQDPDLVVVMPCGFGVARTLDEMEEPGIAEGLRSIPAVRRGGCVVVDGNAYMNRPGPRLADSAELLACAVHETHMSDLTHMYQGVYTPWR
jgi:iron complex transport system substrate-binding protein